MNGHAVPGELDFLHVCRNLFIFSNHVFPVRVAEDPELQDPGFDSIPSSYNRNSIWFNLFVVKQLDRNLGRDLDL